MDTIQKKNEYVTNTEIINFNMLVGLLYEKENNNERRLTDYERRLTDHERRLIDHERRLTDPESELNNLREWSIPDNYTTNDNQFYGNRQNIKLADYAKCREKEKSTEGRLEIITTQLNAVEDKKIQVQIVGELVDEIRKILKEIPKQKNNYRRQTLLMFHETLKQNYTKNLFNKSQVKALNEIARVCNEAFVTKEQYFKMDNILCDCDLDMMPNLE